MTQETLRHNSPLRHRWCTVQTNPAPACPLSRQVSSGSTAWLLHTLLLKVILYLLGIPGGELARQAMPEGCSMQQRQLGYL